MTTNTDPLREEWIDLATDIRAVDGNHSLGAGALAEALTERGWTRAALHVTDTPAPDLCDAPQRGASDLTGLRCIASRGHTGGHEYALRVTHDASMADSHSPAHSDTEPSE